MWAIQKASVPVNMYLFSVFFRCLKYLISIWDTLYFGKHWCKVYTNTVSGFWWKFDGLKYIRYPVKSWAPELFSIRYLAEIQVSFLVRTLMAYFHFLFLSIRKTTWCVNKVYYNFFSFFFQRWKWIPCLSDELTFIIHFTW